MFVLNMLHFYYVASIKSEQLISESTGFIETKPFIKIVYNRIEETKGLLWQLIFADQIFFERSTL